MAGRDINIPFGPDRTGEFDLSSLLPEVEPSTDEQEPAAAERSQMQDGTLPDEAFDPAPARAYGQVDEAIEVEAVDAATEGEAAAYDGSDDGPSAGAKGAIDGVQASLAALKDSIDQGRELKAREKEREEFGQKLDADREELADREDILANYFALTAEQDDIIDRASQEREAQKAALSQLVAEQEQTSDSLARMRDYHDAQLQPLEAALGRAKATAEQAKNDERSRKSELSAAENERRRAEGGDDAAMMAARLEVAQHAYDEAVVRSNSAKDQLDQAQKQYDNLREQVEQTEAPLERSLEDMAAKIEELKEDVNRLGDDIAAARKRRQYCDNVYQYPDETAKLRASVASDEDIARRMDEENDELRDRLADSKQRSKTAKLAIGGVALFIIILIVVFVFVL